jgi:hypothetical protein
MQLATGKKQVRITEMQFIYIAKTASNEAVGKPDIMT